VAAPAHAPVTAQATSGQSYRTYSYQPLSQPAATYNRSYQRPANGAVGGFHDAGWKTRGSF